MCPPGVLSRPIWLLRSASPDLCFRCSTAVSNCLTQFDFLPPFGTQKRTVGAAMVQNLPRACPSCASSPGGHPAMIRVPPPTCHLRHLISAECMFTKHPLFSLERQTPGGLRIGSAHRSYSFRIDLRAPSWYVKASQCLGIRACSRCGTEVGGKGRFGPVTGLCCTPQRDDSQ